MTDTTKTIIIARLPVFLVCIKSDMYPDIIPPKMHPTPKIMRNIPIYTLVLECGINLVEEVEMNPSTSPSNIRKGIIADILR